MIRQQSPTEQLGLLIVTQDSELMAQLAGAGQAR